MNASSPAPASVSLAAFPRTGTSEIPDVLLPDGQPDALRRLHAAVCARPRPRAALVALLDTQARARGAGAPVFESIRRLAEPDVAAVVTGQQVGVLGGPLYTLFKALGAVRHARALSERGLRCVPIFWMASFDHDLAEVTRVKVLTGDHEPSRHTLRVPTRGRAPVGSLPVGPDIARFLAGIGQDLSAIRVRDGLDPAGARAVIDALREDYRQDRTLAEAFARWLGRLTDPHGLILLDPRDPAYAALARPVVERELLGPADDDSSVHVERARGLAAAHANGGDPSWIAHTPTRPRGRLGVFFTDDRGQRVPLLRAADGVSTTGDPALLDRPAIERALHEEPERFTPDALLRPLYQDHVLPTVAAVLGPGERRYHALLGPLYEARGIPRPAIVARPSLLVASARQARELLGPDSDPDARALVAWLEQETAADVRLARAGLEPPLRATLALTTRLREVVLPECAAVRAPIPEFRAGLRDLEAQLTAVPGLLEASPTLRSAVERASAATRAMADDAGRSVAGPVSAVGRALSRIARTLAKRGRRAQRTAFRSLYTLCPPGNNHRQERTMTLAQLLAWLGPSATDRLITAILGSSAPHQLALVAIDRRAPSSKSKETD